MFSFTVYLSLVKVRIADYCVVKRLISKQKNFYEGDQFYSCSSNKIFCNSFLGTSPITILCAFSDISELNGINLRSKQQEMKFLFQCPCCSCFCFMKPKKGKTRVKEVKVEQEAKQEKEE
ncbi:hypothetical protein VNO77_37436 [Canavalia gladiata]|uniref:Uncharacterized protein n=1 Tax=Canavalia gladiata TaxID=3824 RepID=A0AAN9K8V4_CANGL